MMSSQIQGGNMRFIGGPATPTPPVDAARPARPEANKQIKFADLNDDRVQFSDFKSPHKWEILEHNSSDVPCHSMENRDSSLGPVSLKNGDALLKSRSEPPFIIPVPARVLREIYRTQEDGLLVQANPVEIAALDQITEASDMVVSVATSSGTVRVKSGDFYVARLKGQDSIGKHLWLIPKEMVTSQF